MAFYKSMTRYETDIDGFHGVYFENKEKSELGIILMLGDDAEDTLAKMGTKWIMGLGINVMSMSPAKKDYSHKNYPVECIERAISVMREKGNTKFGVMGASTTGMSSLVYSSLIPDLTLTVAVSPSDFVWEGFGQGKKDDCTEWPEDGYSTLSYKGKPLPYMPFVYRHPDYYHMIQKESKETHNMVASRRIFDDSEKAHPITEDEFIKVENIHGILIMAGAEDDCLWDTAKYINRMKKRLESKSHSCKYKALVYEHGTHFLFPESMIKSVLPAGENFVIGLAFSEGKKHPDECKQSRIDFEKNLKIAVEKWKKL